MKLPAAIALVLILSGCGNEKKAEQPLEELQPPVEAMPENVGDNTAPVQIRALKGAKEVKSKLDSQRKEDSKVLEESN